MIISKEMNWGGKTVKLETGKLAKQADGACWVQYEDTVILATVVASKEALVDKDFFPLSVDYQQMAFAAGKIPGGFYKREGKPSEKEILSARIIDRPIRPLFPKGFSNEVQVIVSVLSADKENDGDVLGVVGASAALSISPIPFEGPIAAVRVGRIDGEFIANPTFSQLAESDIDLIISGTEESIIMVEGEAQEISEDDMLAALEFGHQEMQGVIHLQKEMVAEIGVEKMPFEPPLIEPELRDRVTQNAEAQIIDILRIPDKNERKQNLAKLQETLSADMEEEFPENARKVGEIFADILTFNMRKMVVEENRRIDGRDMADIRPITCETSLLPRTHGSAVFTRGQTQALAVTTLGSKMDEQKIDELAGEFWKSYMLHYNFPPFCVGEVKPMRGPSRREIGHGNLAERALKPVLPNESVFPYTVRIVSQILESNGSSSMATVCAGSLSLMDAGVPVKEAVAGIAMGLIKENDEIRILSDILGDEDHMGDMDFKVAGTRQGITAFQMDLKIKGISTEIMRVALEQAREGRLHILDIMQQEIAASRPEISKYAPRIISMKVDTDSIGAIIGPGGKMIREITEKTGAVINIDDDGTVTIAAVDPAGAELAEQIIKNLVEEPEVGQVYDGKVKKITNFGAFVEILPGKEGLLHISEIEHRRINRVEDVLKVGDEVKVKLLKIDPQGKLDLSRKALIENTSPSQGHHHKTPRN
ncbi:polyribonucleotide nucleotidyltransferase [candidate division KSB1 bacterium]|nr:polyribonucleotide nucleotidyltransferase [candidate division KSB1 bacterium]